MEIRRSTLWTLEDTGKEAGPARDIVKASLKDRDEAVHEAASHFLRMLDSH